MVALLPYRLPAWVALSLFSLISLLAILDTHKDSKGEWDFETKWCISWSSISLGLGVIVCITHCISKAKDQFVATKFEGVVIILVLLAWIMAVPVIMAPNGLLAVNENQIINANLYFASWAAFGSSLYMFASFGRETGKVDFLFHAKWWLCLFISSIIAMTAALRLFREQNTCNGNRKELCDELRMGVALSIVSAVTAAVMVILACFKKEALSSYLGLIAALLILVLWSVCIYYLTFDNGPGSKVGNLFFATWISLIISLFLVLSYVFAVSSSSSSSSLPPPKKKEEDKTTKPAKKEEETA